MSRPPRHGPRAGLALLSALVLGWPLASVPGAAATPGHRSAGAPHDPPRLVVLVVLDAFRADYLERFADLFSEDGLGRVLREGAVFPEARLAQAATVSAPSHAALATGRLPGRAGIPADHWYERDTRKYRSAVWDPQAITVGSDEHVRPYEVSPRTLEAPTLGDILQERYGEESLVIALSWKDSSALLLGGRDADGAFWIDTYEGTWVTSTAVCDELPDWVVAHNEATEGVHRYRGETWRRSFDDETGNAYASPDDDPDEPPVPGFPTFPYTIPRWHESQEKIRKSADGTPFGDRTVQDLLLAALESVPLGRDEVPDLLAVSYTALALVSEQFGPDSQETMDVVLQLDRRLAELMTALDESVGPGRWTLALAGSHGMDRLPGKTGGKRLQTRDVVLPLELALRERFAEHPVTDLHAWVIGLARPWVFLSEVAAERAGLSVEKVAVAAAEILAERDDVRLALSRGQALASEDPELRVWAEDTHPERSGDVLVVFDEHVLLAAGNGTTSGSPYDHDRHVPIAFVGAGTATGRFARRAALQDVVPTLARLLDVDPGDVDGDVLDEALATER